MKKLFYISIIALLLSCNNSILNIECDYRYDNDYRYVQIPVNTAKRISDNYTEKTVNTVVVVDTAGLSYLMINCNDIDVEKMKFLIWKDEILPDRFWDNIYKNIKIDYYISK